MIHHRRSKQTMSKQQSNHLLFGLILYNYSLNIMLKSVIFRVKFSTPRESSAPFLSFTNPDANPRRIGDRLVWVVR